MLVPATRHEPVKGAQLIDHVGGELRGGHVDGPPAEAGQVVVADVTPDDDTPFSGCGAGPLQSERVAGVEPAGDIGRRHDVEHGGVVAQAVGAI
jgi:hypothetical protein